MAHRNASNDGIYRGDTTRITVKIKPKFVWMDSTSFIEELGEAPSPQKIYRTKKACEDAHGCINQKDANGVIQCRAIRVAVIEAGDWEQMDIKIKSDRNQRVFKCICELFAEDSRNVTDICQGAAVK